MLPGRPFFDVDYRSLVDCFLPNAAGLHLFQALLQWGLSLHWIMQLQTPLKKARRSNYPLACFHECQYIKGFVFAFQHATPNPPKKSPVVGLATGMVSGMSTHEGVCLCI